MISFVILVTNPTTLFNRLVAHGWLESVKPQDLDYNAAFPYRSAPPNLDLVEFPNPLAQSPNIYNPDGTIKTVAVTYPQRAFSCAISDAREAADTSGLPQRNDSGELLPLTDRTKFGVWVRNSSAAVSLSGYIQDQPVTLGARKLNNVNIWLIDPQQADLFHRWA